MKKKANATTAGLGRRICLAGMNVGGILELGQNCSIKLQHVECLLKIHDSIVNMYWGKLMPSQMMNQQSIPIEWMLGVRIRG